jgi:hypothetical protein
MPGYQTRSLLFSDRPTIEPASKAHKPADSGVVVGNGARRCSLLEVFRNAFKRGVEMGRFLKLEPLENVRSSR